MLKLAHMSDLHYSAKNLQEADKTFGFAVQSAINNQVNAAIISGDSTDHALDGHAPSLKALADQIKKLGDHCPVLMLQGTFSHEPLGVLDMLGMIGTKYPICIASKIGAYGLTQNGWESFNAGVDYLLVATAFPTVNKAELAATVGDKAGQMMGDLLYNLMTEFAPMNEALRRKGVPSILVGHGTVQDCLTEHGVPMSGTDHEFGVGALFSARTDACLLGHIHKHQKWERTFDGLKQTIAYAGSIGRFHYGEEGDKGYLIWNLIPGDTSFEFVATPARETIDLSYAGVPDLDEIKRVVSQNPDAHIRLRYSIDEEHKSSVDRAAIDAILANCAGSQVQGFTQYIDRQRAQGIGQEQSYHAKLKMWVDLTKDEHGANVELLSEKLDLAQTTDAELIVKNIMGQINEFKEDNMGQVGINVSNHDDRLHISAQPGQQPKQGNSDDQLSGQDWFLT